MPLDLGASPVTGMHVSSVYQLRQALGLDPPGTPVKVVEPYQMLGEIAPDLQDALGVDVVGLGRAADDVRLRERRLEALDHSSTARRCWCPAGFNTDAGAQRRHPACIPRATSSVPPSGRMPKGGFYFDTIIRQEPIDEDRLDPWRTTWRSSARSPTPTCSISPARPSGCGGQSDRAILANFGGTAFGDIALVPAPWLKHPKGIRDVAEWYMSTAARFDYVYEVFERQCEIGLANLAKIYDAVGDRVAVVVRHRHRFRHAERPVHQPRQLSQALSALPPPRERLGPPAHALEDVHPFLRLGGRPAAATSSTPASTSSTRCSVRRRAWTRRR